MILRRLFGGDDPDSEDEGTGRVVIRVEFNGKIFTRRYADLEMAQLRFPQYLADLAALHGREAGDDMEEGR